MQLVYGATWCIVNSARMHVHNANTLTQTTKYNREYEMALVRLSYVLPSVLSWLAGCLS